MPVVGTPTTPSVISRDQIRMFMRDRADNNILLDDVQFSNAELDLAIELTVSNFNSITPMSSFTPSSFPTNLRYVLIIGTVKYLLMSESFSQVRSSAVYQDGDLSSLGLSEKAAIYAELSRGCKAEFDELSRSIKNQLNMEGTYNSLGSGYKNVSRTNR